jgi:hypothetical protein
VWFDGVDDTMQLPPVPNVSALSVWVQASRIALLKRRLTLV